MQDLARFDVEDWKNIIGKQNGESIIRFPPDIPGKDDPEKTNNYAKAMTHMVEDAFPNAFIFHRLEQEDVEGKSDLLTFFAQNALNAERQERFDIGTTYLEDYLTQNPNALNGVVDPDSLKNRIQGMQRLYKVAPRYSQMRVLRDTGFDSAQSITRLGRNAFMQAYGEQLGGAAQAKVIYEQASQVSATALNLLAEYGAMFNNINLPVLRSQPLKQVEGIPDLSTLFGSLDLCACEHCQSVYSPAAYLVDLLHFLKDRKYKKTIRQTGIVGEIVIEIPYTAKDVLFQRRLDIEEIELTCQNTNTPVPYVDLVNEVLENAIAPFPPFTRFDIQASLESDLNNRQRSQALADVFTPKLSENAIITVKEKGKWWSIAESAYTYTIKKDETGTLQVISRSLQTSGTPQELSANPQYVNSDAYKKLQETFYPWSLPFDLWSKQARVYLEHLGIQRHELMETFLRGDRPAILSNAALATEHLGLTTFEQQIITDGLKVRLATTTNLSSLSGSPTINGVTVAAGNLVLVKNQTNVAENGIYIVKVAAWERYSINSPTFVTLQEQTTREDKGWLLTIITDGTNKSNKIEEIQPWQFWGLQENGNVIPDPTPSEPNRTAQVGWLKVLESVRRFLDRSGLTYQELLDLLQTEFIKPKPSPNSEIPIQSIEIQAIGVDPVTGKAVDPTTCDTEKLILTNLTPEILSQIHRFIRLWRKLGWTMLDLDRAIATFKPADLNAPFLTQLSHIQRLQAEFDLPIVRILSWWAVIDTANYTDYNTAELTRSPSLYAQLFRNKSVTNPLNLAFTEDASNLNGKLSDHFATITAALGIASEDISLLFNDENVIPRVTDPSDPTKTVPDDKLNLDNLSRLYRHATFAKALKLSIREYLLVRKLIGSNPFASIADTVLFGEKVDKIRSSGFSINELNYLLRHEYNPSSGLAPTEEAIALILDEIRNGLQKIAQENTFTPDTSDPNGNLTKKKLTLLKWDNVLIEEAIATLNSSPNTAEVDKKIAFITNKMKALELPSFLVSPQFLADLTSSPPEFPEELKEQISYDTATRKLQFTGIMTAEQRKKLLALVPSDGEYQTAINTLYVSLVFPENFPEDLKKKFYYDPLAKTLKFVGWMTEYEKQILLALSSNQYYKDAINTLFNLPNTFTPEAGNQFLTASDASHLFYVAKSTDERFKFVLKKLLDYLRRSLSESLVKQKIGEALKLEAKTIEELLTKWVRFPTNSSEKAIAEFLDPTFAESNSNVKLTENAFPDQFKIFTLLHKISIVITKFKITPKQLTWVFQYVQDTPSTGWLDINLLPLLPVNSSAAIFSGWERLVDLFQLRDALPLGETVLSDIFSLARDSATTQATLLQKLSKHTGWNLENLTFLVSTNGFGFTFPNAYKDEKALVRLKSCFAMLKRLGVSAEQCRAWAKPDVTENDARSIKQAVKSKYEDAQWLILAQPLCDILREKQRAALVSYLVTHPDSAKGQIWKDANGLYEYFLIDVEMSPCQMTSRIKQAISTVQLFVQRCLMNLEPEVVANSKVDISWLQWKWMKNYRVWEANRKIFLYPENWIEPELRDDKSPFFKDLENELLQNDLTMDTAETAFLHYLEKLDAVARLEVVGMYHQLETDDGTPNGNKLVDVLHVFGRTHGTPYIYYYRQRVDSAYWTAWEKVDVDIEGDHLIPVIWNRRLHLFWPIFTEKQEEKPVTMPEVNNSIQPGKKYWQIQIARSEYKNKKWSAKKIIVTPEQIFCPSPYSSISPDKPIKQQFVFKGIVDENNLALRFYYYAFLDDGKIYRFRPPSLICEEIRVTGCEGIWTHQFLSSVVWGELPSPKRTTAENMMLLEDSSQSGSDETLYLVAADPKPKDIPTLTKTPGTFRLLVPHQDEQFTSQRPFFFQDDTKTFFIIPQDAPIFREPKWREPKLIDPGILKRILEQYYEKPLIPDPIGPIANPFDPLIHDRSFPVKARLNTASATNVATPRLMTTRMARADSGIATDLVATSRFTDILRDRGRFENLIPKYLTEKQYRFQTFYHPYVCLFVRELNRDGIDGLLQRPIQTEPQIFPGKPSFNFYSYYSPTEAVIKGESLPEDPFPLYPKEDVDFSYSGAYAQYNWELFFHVPLMVGDRLSKNQRFEEAQKWFHYIFDPTDTSGFDVPQRYWRTRPFFETTKEKYQEEQIQNLLRALAEDTSGDRQKLAELEKQVEQWRNNPFKPHLIARMRTTAYQKTVVMKYIDNLIAWGDQLFRRDTIESINEATQLYILAAKILGRRPENIPPRAIPQVQTYKTLEPVLDKFRNALVKAEQLVPAVGENRTISPSVQPPLPLTMLYFCVPKNNKLLGYWDTVADRLFKIRHCMNIEGVVRQLPLFEPPIDPALLVKAVAAGIDISSALNDINAALPHYRFNVMMQKASELCADIKSLGAALLSALEKRDAEELALLRSSHENALLNAVRQIKEKQIDEAKQVLEGLKKSKEVTTIRRDYYKNIAFTNAFEDAHLLQSTLSLLPMGLHSLAEAAAGVLHLIPNAKVGSPTTIGVTYGGANIASALQAFGSSLGIAASMLNTGASLSATLGNYHRRFDDWKLQERLAAKELEQIDKQIAGAEIRVAIAEKELQNHDLQVDNAKEVDVYMRDKFTNQELYDWMVGQISGIYFQNYQLAYDIAKRVEQAYRFELGLKDSNFIQFGYWDSLKKGLLAGERLHHDLKRMEVAYLDQNKREYEITKHISLLMLDAVALIQLKQTGECFVNLPEALFDLDYPGHYLRRIKSVSVTIPCVTGPYSSVNCTLTLLKSSVRNGNTLLNGQYSRQGDNDTRFIDSTGAIQSIVISSAQNDSGLFEPNLRDERYLPFEGAGAISEWRIELPKEFRQFDYDTISDVVLHLRYTAREGGGLLKQQAVSELQTALNKIQLTESQQGLVRLFSARHEFSDKWYSFLHPASDTGDQTLTLPLTKERFPFLFQSKTISIGKIELFVKVKSDFVSTHNDTTLKLSLRPETSPSDQAMPIAAWSGLLRAEKTSAGQPGTWMLTAWRQEEGSSTHNRLVAEAIADIIIVCHYSITG